MGLFVKKETFSPISMHYTINGLDAKRVIFGLGNPGADYELNRHNLGFLAIDKLAEEYGVGWVTKKDQKCLVATAQSAGTQIILAKPTTFMNDSGEAVQALKQFYKVKDSEILVIYDELDIPFGDVRQKLGGSSAGHNGVKSIIHHIGEDFGRLRIGIGPKKPEQMDTADFVLQDFSKPEQKKLPAILQQAISLTQTWLQG